MSQKISKASPADPPAQEEGLYKARIKIHPRSVTGIFATWRWAMVWFTQLLYYGLPWLEWNDRQAVLLDLVNRKFYIVGLVLWPQDVFFLAIILIISAYALFLFTAVAGRLWCGYTCPQTVYTEIFMWIEEKIEGKRSARIKLDQAPLDGRKFSLRALKYGAWVLLALWTGFTLVGYFTPIKTLWGEFWSWNLGPWESFWIFFYAAFTYAFAGHLREQVCLYMCPYARFQGVMFDPDTLVITYDPERGEPRGSRKKGVDPRSVGKGDCVDCDICVQVCPTGIDIRDGLQYECIGCAACIDACDDVMAQMNYPKGLIRYTTENALEQHWGWKEVVGHIVRPRIIIYTVILVGITLALIWGLANKADLRVNVLRDRAILSREVEGGLIENVYRLQVMNVTEQAHRYTVSVSGLEGIKLEGNAAIEVPSVTSKSFPLSVRVPLESGKQGAHTIYFDVKAENNDKMAVHEKATFLIP
ncbi:MAG: cytochrome c oxidase accessory protein CcoG [Gammaproteobacteria bacterium]|nr:cytochrome c oxidase accessory protein CcoG [Rhodocyclaceae bacterium]MBU3910398.1 cytochrome c oxidase accessory protein CcoG [Gammaproteobacteria bacterium]MBU3989104.1 cytochrome c oxidase accessory protein CcoG [Gammaproteobacteria bacterium]MBU4004879.1 cytochrome c oxidase accessory protein CcoG [Gammaproteobacteria bacterium]MBU4020472.1 cytochrome c oxidase accessory protein CcoG [Gammaproteobacteria bacterium]